VPALNVAPGRGTVRPHAVRVVGHRWGPESHEIRDLLARYQVPYDWLDVESHAEARRVLDECVGNDHPEQEAESLPLVILGDGTVLRHPSVEQLATALGLVRPPRTQSYDLVIVGAGPAGLAAAVYGACDGLRVVVVEGHAPGGQAAASARIENYLGFPSGLSGTDLTRRAVEQARRFGVEIVSLFGARSLEVRDTYRVAHLVDGRALSAEAVILACGGAYRRLDVPGAERLTNRGVYYGAGNADAPFCAGERVAIVGGGNSAGQAALNFVRYASGVDLLVRDDRLDRDMSAYLVDRIVKHRDIAVRLNTQVVRCEDEDEGWLRAVDIYNAATGDAERLPVRLLFVFVGAQPHSEWLEGILECDDHGFLLTGPELPTRVFPATEGFRDPYMLECSVPGVFAAGDVRARSTKRIAAAVGEGSMAVSFVHRYLDR
jgi:thioredoxin reductase (NADPH)